MVEKRLPTLQRIISGSLANVAYFAAQSLIFLILTPVLLRILGEDIYGIWTILLSVVVFSGLINFGSIAAGTKYTAQFSVSAALKEKLSGSITFQYIFTFFVSLLISLVCWASRNWIANRIQTNVSISLLTNALGLVAISLMPNYMAQVSRGVLLGLLHNKLIGGIFLVHDILLWVGALVIGVVTRNVVYLGWWVLITNVSRFLISLAAVMIKTRSHHLHFVWDKCLYIDLLRYTLKDWFGVVGVALFTIGARILVGLVLGSVAAGVYGIASGVVIRVLALADYLSQTLSPFASSYQEGKKVLQIKQVFRHAVQLVSILTSAVVTFLVVWMDIILNLWISPEFSNTYADFFRMITIATGIYAFSSPAVRILEGMGWVFVRSVVQFFCGIFMLLALTILADKYGLAGAMGANFVLSFALIMNVVLAKRLGLKPISTIFTDMRVPLFVFLLLGVLSYINMSILARVVITCAIFVVLARESLNGDRGQLLYKALLNRVR